MTCCILEKQITTTVIPGDPGTPATPGTPARAAYCAISSVNVCEWIPNPAVTYRWELIPAWFDGLRWIPAYYGWVTYFNGVKIGAGILNVGGVQPVIQTCHAKEVVTCYPAQAAVPGNPGTPPTPSQIIISKNLGWNSHSRAIDPLDVDSILNFTLKSGVRGVFVGLAPAGLDGQRLRAFPHGLLVDASGVWAYESGVKVHQLAATYSGTTAFQIERSFDGSITYRADLDEYVSAIPADGDLYPYTYMYAGGDRMKCASYEALEDAGISMAVEVTLPPVRAVLGEAGVDYVFIDTGLGGATSEIECSELEEIGITANVPGLEVILGEAGVDYDFIQAYLPSLTTSQEEAEYVPPPLTEMYGNLPIAACAMHCTTVELCDVEVSLGAVAAVMGEGDYSFINTEAPSLVNYLVEGVRLDMWMVDALVVADPSSMVRDLVLTVMSDGSLASVQEFEIVIDQEYMSALEVSSIQSMLADYSAVMMSDIYVQSVQLMTLPAGAALNGLGRVWVVNLDNAAASQYDDYAFNSFFTRDGRHYGVADDGIYLLEGDDDAGAPIQALAELGLSNFGTSRAKLVPSLYLGVASTGAMVVKAVADGQAYYYTARSSSTDLKNHRVDTGRGLKGVNWSFTVLNQDGGDFDLASIEFVPLETKRRI